MRRDYQLTVLSILVTAALLPGLTTSAAPWDAMRVKHAWNTVPADWESLGPPPAGTTINIHVALKPHNENALIDTLYEVSSPGHLKKVLSNTPRRTMYLRVPLLRYRYGSYLSKEGVANLVAPHPDTFELIYSWLAHHGLPSSSISSTHSGSWLTLTGVPVSQANRLLGASYQLYRHAGTNESTILRTVGYALPELLHTHVQTVTPTTSFAFVHTPSVGAAAKLAKVGSREPVTVLSSRDELDRAVTPEYLRWLYKTFAYVPTATDKNLLGIAGFRNEYPSPEDLFRFMIVLRPDAVDAGFDVEEVNDGWYDPSDPGMEANVDMQYTQAISYPTPHIFYSTGGWTTRWWHPTNEPTSDDPLFALLAYLISQKNVPQTINISYSASEMGLPLEYAEALCELFAELGARGVSIICSTGDDGVGPEECKVNDGSGRVQFSPVFPATCPWVTSVGGTTSQLPEVAASLSGGGFSNHFPRPDYQINAVPTFLRRIGSRYDGLYNASGRGIPDIAAQAFKFVIAVNTIPHVVSGTSCAAPTVAAIISLLNDFLLSNGMPPLGFLNPWLYGNGTNGLNDITSGSNPGCGTKGFSAIAGWDPVTGLGTPDFFELQHVLLITGRIPLKPPKR